MSWTVDEIARKFLSFMEERGHVVIEGHSVRSPTDDVLFTTAGMHPLTPYLLGEPHPDGRRLADVQRCVRTTDIDEVGDNSHLTVFEMLGNWSLGDYFKETSIPQSFDLLMEYGVDPTKLYVSVFGGSDEAPADSDSPEIWRQVYADAGVDPTGRINPLGADDNWWSNGPTGPCGPDTEMFVWVGDGDPPPFADIPQYVEIWNNVFMTFDRSADGGLTELTQHNVDTGMGLERIALFLNGHNSVWQLDEMVRLQEAVADPLGTSPDRLDEGAMQSLHIVTDHLRAGLAIAAAGIFPSATRQGYILRKLIRRAVRHAELLKGTDQGLATALATSTANASEIIGVRWPDVGATETGDQARETIAKETEKFSKTVRRGVENLHEVADETGVFDGDLAFRLADERGFPAELSLEEAQRMGLTVDPDWNVRYEELRELQRARSRVSAGGLVDSTAASPALGLTAAEVAERVADGRVNTFAASAGRSTWQIVAANVFTLFNLIVGALFVVMLFVGPIQDALFGLVAIANTLIGTVQELRAKRSLERLALIGRPKISARRHGAVAELQPDEVVVDDVLLLASGTQAVVDGVVVEATSLEIDESLLTGESDPVAKQPGDPVMSGSFVVAGTGTMSVTAVGGDSYAAQLVTEASRFQVVHSQIRADIDRVLKLVTWIIIPISALLAFSQLRDGENIDDAISGTVAGIITMIPEGLVLLTSIAFAVGVVRLGRQGCLVQELGAVEGLARVDVVCADKTGTLTEDRMEVGEVLPLDGAYDAQIGTVLAVLAASDEAPNASIQAIGTAFAQAPGWPPSGRAAFSSARKWSGISFGDHGNWLIGAPEMLLPPGSPAIAEAGTRAEQGLRVLLLGHGSVAVDDADAPGVVTPTALVVLAQAVRPDSGPTLDYFRDQGVAVKVISGDDPRTVGAIASRLGLERAEHPVDARGLGDDSAAIAAAVQNGSVFGRVTPHQKREMVGALQAQGHTVAMTGDGVNDVLALKDADVGISMGSGSAATRSVAQLVLLQNKFSVLPSVVAEGRKVIGNIERVAKLFLTKTMYGALMAVAVGIVGLPFPFLPRHLTVVTALTIGIPAFVLAFAPNKDLVAPQMVKRVLRFSIPAGVIATACSFGSYWVCREFVDSTLEQDRTTATISLLIVGLGVLVAVARPLVPWKLALVAAMVGLFALCFIIPRAREVLALEPGDGLDTVITIAVSLVGAAAVILIGQRTIPRQG